MPKFTVTVLRHQIATIEVEAVEEIDAVAMLTGWDDRPAIVIVPEGAWETTLIDPIEVDAV